MLYAIASLVRTKDNVLHLNASLGVGKTIQDVLREIRLVLEEDGSVVVQMSPCQATDELYEQIANELRKRNVNSN